MKFVHICIAQYTKPQALKPQTNGTHTCSNQCMKREMSQCCGIKQYTQTEKITANGPDIIIKNKKEKTCTLIDVTIPADRNVVQKEAEKKLNTRVYTQRYNECGT